MKKLALGVMVAMGALATGNALAAHRERFPAWMDADEFDLR